MSSIVSSAVIDETCQYRYSLVREWDSEKPRVLFVMLNGSTADAEKDDPTLRRCIGFARAWGYGSLEVVNLFGYRTTFPQELKRAPDPVGPENDRYILAAVRRSNYIIAAWGTHGKHQGRDKQVIRLLIDSGATEIMCLELTKDGHPRHPLYVRGDTKPELYRRTWDQIPRGIPGAT
ncbi:MAG: hypothetical protein JL50_03045 [Peptococcaceae bacterium BICA1-7]|nr:MAG: hypothetical protein JL50_03045 [Peptococcaceae bacterium BICA1-7]HBV97759.1 hypothetical protein [Desulfotomaculum sp.]